MRDFLVRSVVIALAFSTGSALAATKGLTLKVQGSVKGAPAWQDAGGAAITEVSFDFGALVAGEVAAVDVNSADAQVKLVNALAYPASVSLVRPQGCAIGATNVANSDVVFIDNGAPVATNGNLSLSNALQTYALRFSQGGNYGTASGAVACATNGSMTYSY